MKAMAVFAGIVVVGMLLALLVGLVARQSAPVPDTGEILEGATDLVESLVDGDVRFVREITIWSTWSNGVYLTQAMPYVAMAVGGAVLAMGLGLVAMAVAWLLSGGNHGNGG